MDVSAIGGWFYTAMASWRRAAGTAELWRPRLNPLLLELLLFEEDIVLNFHMPLFPLRGQTNNNKKKLKEKKKELEQ